jgi:hypothetical protein
MEVAQLGTLKILLREVLASARNSSAAAANAQCAANAATAAVEAVAALRAAMDTQAASTSSTTPATLGPAAPGKAGGSVVQARPSRETPSSRMIREKYAPNGMCGARDRNILTHAANKEGIQQATSPDTGLETGICTSHVAATAAAAITLGDATAPDASAPDVALSEEDLAWSATQTAGGAEDADGAAAAAMANQEKAMAGKTCPCPTCSLTSPCSSQLPSAPRESGVTEAELGPLLAAAMLPVRGELKRLRAILADLRSSLDRDSSNAPNRAVSPLSPPSLPYWPYPEPPPLQHYQRRAAPSQSMSTDPITQQSSPRRRTPLAIAGSGTARGALDSPSSSPAMPWRPGHDAAGGGGERRASVGATANTGGLGEIVSWLMGPTSRLEPDNQGPALSSSPHPPSSLLPAC